MDYRIEKMDAFEVICRRKTVAKAGSETATADISAFWTECQSQGITGDIVSYFPAKPKLKGLLGICFSDVMQKAIYRADSRQPENGTPERKL